MAFSSNLSTGSVFMCQEVKGPLDLAWAVPEMNGAIRATSKEFPKGMYNNSKSIRLRRQLVC